MAILKIARAGHPVLARVADPIEDFDDPALAQLIEDMVETMDDAGGTGLAAPQVYVSKRVVIFEVDGGRDAREGGAGEDVPLTLLINPKIEPLSDEKVSGWEGCLSIPGMMGRVERYTHIRYTYQDLDGETRSVEAKGFHARVVQHECDHLDGLVYPQRMTDLGTLGFVEEITRAVHEQQQEGEPA